MGLRQPLEFIKPFKRITRAERVNIKGGKRCVERIGCGRFGESGCKQWQIIKPRRQPARLRPASLKFGKHRLCTRKHWRGKARKPPNRDAVTAIGRATRNLMQQHKIALKFRRADMMERKRIEAFGKPG